MRKRFQIQPNTKQTDYVLCFTRGDYRHSAAGIEKYLSEERVLLADRGISMVCIFPLRTRRNPKVDTWLSKHWGVINNSVWSGFWKAADFATRLLDILPYNGDPLEIHLHHIQDYPLDLLAGFLRANAAPIRLFIHDYHLICSQYTLLQNNLEYCGSTRPSADTCEECCYWDATYVPAMRNFLEGLRGRLNIVAPSAAARHIFLNTFPEWTAQVHIVPHWRVVETANSFRPSINKPLRIAFVGSPLHLKGWDVFLQVSQSEMLKATHSKFFHFGKPSRSCPANIQNVSVSFVQDGRNAMSSALRNAGIDIVVLWSICPETYSYTLYESLQAGTMIITNPNSGNIADEVSRSDVGIVFPGKSELIEYLADFPRVQEDAAKFRQNSFAKFSHMVVNDEIYQKIPPKKGGLGMVERRLLRPEWSVNALYVIKNMWRRWRLTK